MTLVRSSCLSGANPPFVCCVALLGCGCGQLDPHRSPAHASTPFTGEARSHPERGCVGAGHRSELLHRSLCCLLPQIKFQHLHSVGGTQRWKDCGVWTTFTALHPSLHIHSFYMDG